VRNGIWSIAGIAMLALEAMNSSPAAVVSPTGETHPLTVEDLLAVRSVARVELSPDGKHMLIVTRGINLTANVPTSNTYLSETHPGSELQSLPAEAAQGQWQSDSKALTFLRPGQDCTQIWRVAVDTREAAAQPGACLPAKGRMLTTFHWSADGRFLAFLSQPPPNDALQEISQRLVAMPQQTAAQACIDLDSDEARAKGMDALDLACSGTSVGTGWMWGLDVASPALRAFSTQEIVLPPTELWVFETKTGSARRVSDAAADVRQFDWSAKGHELAWITLTRDIKKDPGAPYQAGSGSSLSYGGAGSLVWADVSDAVTRPPVASVGTLTPIDLYFLGLHWSPDGRQIAYGTRDKVLVYPKPVSADVPQAIDVFKGKEAHFSWFDWSADSRSLYALWTEHQTQNLMRIEVKSGRMTSATSETRWQGKPSLSADHRSFALSVEDVTEPTRIYLGSDTSRGLKEIIGHQQLNPHWSQVAGMVRGRIDWRSWDNKWNLYGVTIAPREPASKSRPMVVVLLGAGMPTSLQFGIDNQQPILLLAAAGYTVFIPNNRGRSGITPRGYESLGEEHTYFSKPWQDVMQSIDLLIAKGLADSERIGLMGFSYGGGLAGWGLTHTTRFKAAILKEPVSLNMAAGWRGIWGHPGFGGDVIGKKFGIESPYEGEGKNFIEYESALPNVSAVRTPTLLEFGVKSGGAMQGGNEFYQGLMWYRVPAELVLYPRTIHGFVEPVLIADSFRREMKWFVRWLSP
jgi:dipeptidyl aminopeptidase/acylaminoacyl peptidase